jgi:hypothetical protein
MVVSLFSQRGEEYATAKCLTVRKGTKKRSKNRYCLVHYARESGSVVSNHTTSTKLARHFGGHFELHTDPARRPYRTLFLFLFRGSSDGCGFDGAIVQRLDWAIVGFEAGREGA